MHELERARAEVYPVYDHYQMYTYLRHTQRMAQIVHMGNTLHNPEYLSWCTDSSLLTVIIVIYVWNTTSTHIAWCKIKLFLKK